jgi:uncharacterized protein (DUF433 family)
MLSAIGRVFSKRKPEVPMAHDRIEINPEIMGGKPVIRGTRIPVETVLRKLGAGMTTDDIAITES